MIKKIKTKRIILFFIILLFASSLYWYNKQRPSIRLYINSNLWLKAPSKAKSYFKKTVFGGESLLEIWEYKSNIKDVIRKKKFEKIKKSDISLLNEYINQFYDGTTSTNEPVFKRVISVEQIIIEGNYYFYKPFYHNYEDSNGTVKQLRSFVLLIADTKTNKLYYCIYDT